MRNIIGYKYRLGEALGQKFVKHLNNGENLALIRASIGSRGVKSLNHPPEFLLPSRDQ